MNICIRKAAWVLRDGGVITCPTEGVFGLSCMPDNALAILRLLAIKERGATQGLILIAASKEQLREWIAIPTGQIQRTGSSYRGQSNQFEVDGSRTLLHFIP
jgi:L-threonylcarbamoyladenylate synthase